MTLRKRQPARDGKRRGSVTAWCFTARDLGNYVDVRWDFTREEAREQIRCMRADGMWTAFSEPIRVVLPGPLPSLPQRRGK